MAKKACTDLESCASSPSQLRERPVTCWLAGWELLGRGLDLLCEASRATASAEGRRLSLLWSICRGKDQEGLFRQQPPGPQAVSEPLQAYDWHTPAAGCCGLDAWVASLVAASHH